MKSTIKLIMCMALMLVATAMYAQVPQMFNYQGIARDAKGNPLANQQMSLKLSVLPTSDATVAEYEEIQKVTTNEFGLYTLQIGNGTPVSGEMKNVKWETGNKYIKVAIDAKGGNDYVEVGTSQLLSVPYALYADHAGSSKEKQTRAGAVNTAAGTTGTNNMLAKFTSTPNTITNSIVFDNGTRVGIGTTTPSARLQVSQDTNIITELVRMRNTHTDGAGRFTMYSDAANNYATFTKYGSSFVGGYPGIAALYPYGNLLAFGNNGIVSGDGLGRFLISSGGNIGISLFKSGVSKLKFHADFATENVGIGGSATPAARVHLNNTDGTVMELMMSSNNTGHTNTDGFVIQQSGSNVNMINKENGDVRLWSNNTERVRVTAAGNVGIGTTTPAAALDVNGQIRMQGGAPGLGKIMTSNATGVGSWSTAAAAGLVSGSGTLNYVPKFTPSGNTVGNSMIYDSMGFYYNTPYDINYFTRFQNPNAVGGNWVQFQGNNSGYTFLFLEDSSQNNKGVAFRRSGSISFDSTGLVYQNIFTNTLNFSNNIANHMSINLTNGNIGIGTAPNISAKLDVVNSASNHVANFDATSGSAFIGISEGGVYRGYIGSFAGAPEDIDVGTGISNATGSLHLTTEASPKVTINPSGNVGIGTTTPIYKLDLEHSGASGIQNKSTASFSTIDNNAFNGDAALRFSENGAFRWNTRNEPTTNDYQIFQMGVASRMKINSATGNVGIGSMATATAKLHVSGNIRIADGTEGNQKTLVSAADGTASWQGAVAFKATTAPSGILAASANVDRIYGFEVFDMGAGGNNYDPVTGVFTAPVSGLYQFVVTTEFNGNSGFASGYTQLALKRNGVTVAGTFAEMIPPAVSSFWTFTHTTILQLNAGDAIIPNLSNFTNVGQNMTGTGTWAQFSGNLIR